MRILHFSDFHLSKDGLNESRNLVDRMIDAVKKYPICEPVDAIVFTGDMIDKGGSSFTSAKEAYKSFHEIVISEMCRRLSVDETMFFAVPGNHEVNRNLTDKEDDLRLEANLKSSEAIHNHLISSNNKGFSERLREYNQFYRQPWQARGSYDTLTSVKLADHFIIKSDGREIGISLLNSAWRCGKKLNKNEAEKGNRFVAYLKNIVNAIRGVQVNSDIKIVDDKWSENRTLVGAAQITEAVTFFRKKGIKYKISLIHHHYSSLGEPDDDDIERELQKNYTICFCGHKHRPKSEKTEEDDEIIIATAPGVIRWNTMNDGRNQNGFSIWNIDFSNERASEMQFIQKYGNDFELQTWRNGSYIRNWYWNLKRHLRDFHVFYDYRRLQLDKDITSDSLECLCGKLKFDKSNTLVLYGLPGLGKTHLIHKTFKDYKKDGIFSQITVTESSNSANFDLKDELRSFFCESKGKKACVIVDNTDIRAFLEIIKLRDETNSDVKLIGVMNQCDYIVLNRYGITTLELKTDYTRDAIDIYVEQKINDIGTQHTVKTISDGFPFVAIKIVEKLLATGLSDKRDAQESILQSRFVIDEELRADPELYEMLCAMAIFKPFPKLEKDSMNLWQSKHLSGLYNKTHAEIVQLIEKAKQLWHGEIVESSESGYSIRPYLVANWLAESWFEKYNDSEIFIGLLNDIAGLPGNEPRTAISCLKQRLSDMNDCVAAKELMKKLTSDDGLFRCEDVVFSELGSQLVLAMSNVNPNEISEAIREIIFSSSLEIIKGLHYMVRRNVVFTLTNTLFYKESFIPSIEALGMLALNETEDTISNNSRGVFASAFHIFLSGTQASLQTRFNWLKSIINSDSPLVELVPIAIQNALAAGTFVHTGGMGPRDSVQKDFQPSANDIKLYWTGCCQLAIKDIEGGENIKIYQNTLDNNLRLWGRFGVLAWVLPLIQALVDSEFSDWSMLESDFNDIINDVKDKESETYKALEGLRHRIVRSDFFSRLKSRQKDYYSSDKSTTSNPEEEIQYFDSLTREFLDKRAYQDSELIDQLLTSIDFVCWAFCANLSNQISDEILSEFYEAIFSNKHLTCETHSPFLFTFCSMTRDKIPTRSFINGLLERGLYSLYTKLMARTEDDELSHLNIIKVKIPGKNNYLSDYLNNVSLTVSAIEKIIEYLDSNFDNISEKDDCVHFIITHCGYTNLVEASLKHCKSILLKYSPDENSVWVTRDILRFATSLLERADDYEFAFAFHQLVIGYTRNNVDIYGVREFYKHVLEKYPEKMLEPLLLSMIDCKYDSAAQVMIQELGTSMGFGVGVLFQIDENLLLEQLSKHRLPIARLYSRMCPIFLEGETFSKLVYRLLDEYGDDE